MFLLSLRQQQLRLLLDLTLILVIGNNLINVPVHPLSLPTPLKERSLLKASISADYSSTEKNTRHESLASETAGPAPKEASQAQASEAYGRLPLSFEANRGQANSQIKFLSRGAGYDLFLSPTEAVFSLTNLSRSGTDDKSLVSRKDTLDEAPTTITSTVRMKFLGSNLATLVEGCDELPGKSNYFISDDPAKWRANIPTYSRVKYKDLYPGVDIVYYGDRQQLEYDFVVAPGANPGIIRAAFKGVQRTRIDASGDLILRVAGREIRQMKPVIYQEEGGVRQDIDGRYILKGNHEVGFKVADYDPNKPLIIDPVFIFSTYLGGSNDDIGYGIALDAAGNTYVTGETWSRDFPTANPLQSNNRGQSDVFVAKLNATGTALVYSTYLGGSGRGGDVGYSIAVDGVGNAYVTGYTRSNDFPIVNPLQSTNKGGTDAFVAKLNATGTALVYSTYLGGSDFADGIGDWGYGIAVDAVGNAYVTGETVSTDFPTVNPLQPNKGGGHDAFVVKLNATGTALVYSTYLGGSAYEHSGIFNDFNSTKPGNRIAVDGAGNVYVTGYTFSTDFPTVNPLQANNKGQADVFVSKLNPAGTGLIFSTYVGGSNSDFAYGIAVDASGNVYVTGDTASTNFPTKNPLQPTKGGGQDVFIMKLNAAGSALMYSTYLGGSAGDFAHGVTVDASGNVYIIGETLSNNFPTANPLQSTQRGASDVIVSKLNATGTDLLFSTYLGGTTSDNGAGIAVDTTGNIYITGGAASTNFPTINPLQFNRGSFDTFVAKIFDSSIFSVQAVVSNRGGNTGDVSVAILGAGFQTGATVKLKALNQPDIEGGNSVVSNTSRMTATFNLRGAVPGPRDVVITLPDGTIATLRNGFTIEEGRAAEVWVDILGRNNIRTNTQQTYTIVYGNRGNIDAPTPVLELSSPDAVQVALFDGRPFQDAPLRIFAGGQGGPAGVLPPGGAFALQVKVKTPKTLGQIRLDLSIVQTAGQAFDWNRLADEGAPAGTDLNDWRARVAAARSLIGETMDNVLTVMRSAASESGGDASAFYDFDEFLRYVVGVYGAAADQSSATTAKRFPASRLSARIHHARLSHSRPSAKATVSTDSNSDRLIPIVKNPNPTQTIIIFHGAGGIAGTSNNRTDFFDAAASIAAATPGANVYLFDWTDGARKIIPGTNKPNPWAVAFNINRAGDDAYTLMKEQGLTNLANTTFIGHSDGVFVMNRTAERFAADGSSKVHNGLALDIPTVFGGYTPSSPLTKNFDQSRNVGTVSFFDSKRKLADYNLLYETTKTTWEEQHMDPLKALIAHSSFFLGLFSNPSLRKAASDFESDGRIKSDGETYDPTPFSFLFDSKLWPGAFPTKTSPKTLPISIVNSRDPNDKVGALGAGESRYITGEEPLRYMISFENVATATASAQQVVITDQLDTSNLDLSSFSLGPIDFGNNRLIPPPGTSEYNASVDLRPDNELIVNVEARLNKETGLITWKFTSIDPAMGLPTNNPLAGFLPPNSNPPDGEGSVFFTVMPKQGLLTGTEIHNHASIVFDNNAAISTATWSNTLDNSAPASAVNAPTATPCSSSLNVQWSGTDTGSGIRDYTIYVSVDGGPLTVWQSNTTATSGTYAGQFGHTYAFYSVAQDMTGNIESAPSNPDTIITLSSLAPPIFTSVPPSITVYTGQGATACGAFVSDAVLGTATAQGDCPAVNVTRSGIPSGNLFPVGNTTITYMATDALGNTASATQSVTVVDNTPPTLTVPVPTAASTDSSCQAAIPDAVLGSIASDNCGGKVTLTQNPAAGTLVGPGSHTITVTATDSSGNSKGVSTTFNVIATPSFLLSITPTTVKRGSTVTLKVAFSNCASSRQAVTLKVSLMTPRSNTLMLTLPIMLQAGQKGSLSIPLTIPKSTPTGLYSLTLDVYVGGTKVGTSTAQLTVTP